jgi:two-component system alkaline phosphatase synthesis response regulator PhoP
MAKRILIVEDELHIVKLVRAYLEQAGYEVLTAVDGADGLRMARQERPDLIILDLMLPEMDGLDVCQAVRRDSNVPIIMLTARIEEVDKLLGLGLGADDYMTKPFSPRELVARVRAVLRRVEGLSPETEYLVVGDVTLDMKGYTVDVRGAQIDVTSSEFALLATLMRHPGQVFKRLQLLEQIQGYGYEGYERTVDTHVKNVRQKIERNPHEPEYIITVYGVGYKFREK